MAKNGSSETKPTAKCSFQTPLRDAKEIRDILGLMLSTYVFHESIEASSSRSTHRRHSLGRTTRQFHLDGTCIQCCNFSTDLEGKANFWSLFASGRLQPVLAQSMMGENSQRTPHLVHITRHLLHCIYYHGQRQLL